jgi:hypothetical protein
MVEPLIDGVSKVFSQDGEWLSSKQYEGSVDMTVFHPPESMIDGRASWLVKDSNRKPFLLSATDIPRERPLVIKALLKSEWIKSGDLAIPVDQILIEEKEVLSLYLPKGNYILKSETWSGEQTVFREDVTIE